MTKEETERAEAERRKRNEQEEEDRKRRNRDNSVTGSAITDGLIGIPSSGLAIAIDIATPGGLF